MQSNHYESILQTNHDDADRLGLNRALIGLRVILANWVESVGKSFTRGMLGTSFPSSTQTWTAFARSYWLHCMLPILAGVSFGFQIQSCHASETLVYAIESPSDAGWPGDLIETSQVFENETSNQEWDLQDSSSLPVQSQYDETQIAELAIRQSTAARMVLLDNAAKQAGLTPAQRSRSSGRVRQELSRFYASRLQQVTAANAVKLHYGLVTVSEAITLFSETGSVYERYRSTQDRAVELGLSIPDPMLLDRLANTRKSKLIETESTGQQLRLQLAVLIPPSIACHYQPIAIRTIDLSEIDPCTLVELAYQNRCDLQLLIYLRSQLDEDTRDLVQAWSSILVGVPMASANPIAATFVGKWLRKSAIADELLKQRQLLDHAIQMMRQKIATEVLVAAEKRRLAVEKIVLQEEQVELLKARVAQLELYSDQVESKFDELIRSELESIEARFTAIQLRGEWLQAAIDLELAIGVR